MDMLDEGDARPDKTSTVDYNSHTARKVLLVKEIAENGEAIVTTRDGQTVEFHGADSHFYPYEGVMFTETETAAGDDAETWVFGEDVISVQRH